MTPEEMKELSEYRLRDLQRYQEREWRLRAVLEGIARGTTPICPGMASDYRVYTREEMMENAEEVLKETAKI